MSMTATIGVAQLLVAPCVELDGEEWGDGGYGGVGEEAEVLAGHGPWRVGGVGYHEGHPEPLRTGYLAQYGEDEWGREGGDRRRRGVASSIGGQPANANGCGEEGVANRSVSGFVRKADHWPFHVGVADELQLQAAAAIEGVEEELDGGGVAGEKKNCGGNGVNECGEWGGISHPSQTCSSDMRMVRFNLLDFQLAWVDWRDQKLNATAI